MQEIKEKAEEKIVEKKEEVEKQLTDINAQINAFRQACQQLWKPPNASRSTDVSEANEAHPIP